MEKLFWRTEKRKVSALKAYENNPRQITADMFEKLKKSIDELGYAELVAIDTDNVIVAGHMRVKALTELGRGEEEIEVRVPSRKLTEQEFKRYLVQSNKVTGSWNYDTLANIFEVQDLQEWGFTPAELGLDANGKNEVDKDKINESLDSYLEGDIKQIVLYYKADQYPRILERLETLLKDEKHGKDYSELFLNMLTHYENTGANK